ncbi:hypothetical protein SDC9_61312 [bioreactor metagenome]|uniref:Uncharacterized protein n=1 Tax=bioreactor metagenome TaxID=1076179 RepID=A0A644XGQ6_9ZZZZ
MALDGPASHLHRAGTEEGVLFGDRTLLQRGSKHHGFEGGTRLVGIVEGLVAPLVELGVAEGLEVILLTRRVFYILQLGYLCGVADRPGVVEVVFGGTGHGVNGAGGGIHHDAEAAFPGFEPGDALGEGTLGIVLDGGINGEMKVVAVHRVHVIFIAGEHFGARTGLCGDDPSVHTRELIVTDGLDAVGAVIVAVYETDYLGGQRGGGIITLGTGRDVEPVGQMVIQHKLPYLGGNLLFYPGGQNLVSGIDFFQMFHDFVRVRTQNGSQAVGDEVVGGFLPAVFGGAFPVFLFKLLLHQQNIPGGQDDVVCGGRDGQDVSLRVINGAPVGGDGHVTGLLFDRLGLVKVMIDDLDLPQLDEERPEGNDPEHNHEKKASAKNDPVGAPALWFSVVSLLHVPFPPALRI